MNELFDRIAGRTSDVVSRAPFFVFCVLSIAIWAPSLPLFNDTESWQLPINTFTTVVTFLLVALLQNSQRRTELAMHRKLDAISEGLADLMHQTSEASGKDVERDIVKLRQAAGTEMASSDGQEQGRRSGV
jgi:low affinity Fe/Cu permease